MDYFLHPRATALERERKLQIRYVKGSFVAGTSALSPGVPRHIRYLTSSCTSVFFVDFTIFFLFLFTRWLLNSSRNNPRFKIKKKKKLALGIRRNYGCIHNSSLKFRLEPRYESSTKNQGLRRGDSIEHILDTWKVAQLF